MPEYLNDAQKQRLIENGTYNVDGSVNLNTAAKLGWMRAWSESATAAPAAQEPPSRRNN